MTITLLTIQTYQTKYGVLSNNIFGTIDIAEVVSVLLWRPRTQRSVEYRCYRGISARGIFMYAQSATVNYNDGNQISLPQQRSARL